MDSIFVERFFKAEAQLRQQIAAKPPASYLALIGLVVAAIAGEEITNEPALDVERIVEIDHGNYQGTLVYVIGERGYQPHDYYYVRVGYGSCSGCDTLEAIRGSTWHDEPMTEQQIGEYMTLCLHVVQGLKRMGGDVA